MMRSVTPLRSCLLVLVLGNSFLSCSSATENDGSCSCSANRGPDNGEARASRYEDTSSITIPNSRHIATTIEEMNRKMIYIAGGKGSMGTDDPVLVRDGESPRRDIVLEPFYIDQFEVSNQDFKAFVDATNYTTESEEFAWSFVFNAAVPKSINEGISQAVAAAQWWLPVNGSYWLYPEGKRDKDDEVSDGGDIVGDATLSGGFQYLLGRDVFSSGRALHPVIQVSHRDAAAFCAWRSYGSDNNSNSGSEENESSHETEPEDTGTGTSTATSQQTSAVVRLPTEAEWEYAANGPLSSIPEGVDSGDGEEKVSSGHLYPWGPKFFPNGTHRANIFQGMFPTRNTQKDGYLFTAPVDAYGPQNAYGLYNMVGNVWEWVSDWHSIDHYAYAHLYSTSSSSSSSGGANIHRQGQKLLLFNPQGPPSGKEKVKKGGSFLCHKSYCYRYRNAARYPSSPDSGAYNIGFRCAMSAANAPNPNPPGNPTPIPTPNGISADDAMSAATSRSKGTTSSRSEL